MKRLVIVAAILLVCRPAAAGEKFVAAAAHTAGSNNTFFKTDLRIVNLSSTSAEVKATFLPAGVDNSAAQPITVSIGSRQSMEWIDVLSSLFGLPTAVGAIRISSGADLVVSSRTYTPSGNAACPGSYGQFIPGVDSGTALSRSVIPNVTISGSPAVGFRTNLGFVNPTAGSITVVVTLRSADGSNAGSGTVTLPPLGFLQQSASDLFKVTSPDSTNDFVEIAASAPIFAYASVVDNESGDPVFIPASLDTGDPVSVKSITARQWSFEPGTVEVIAGQPVTFQVTSRDVDHGISFSGVGPFTCSSLQGGQCVLKPNETVTVSFTPMTTGSFAFFCTRFCGESMDGTSGHATMRGTLIVK
ncbi:MAG: hypothetical protein ABI718_01635 [Acidobacteriota bacterium]